jgi:hypothetical protein
VGSETIADGVKGNNAEPAMDAAAPVGSVATAESPGSAEKTTPSQQQLSLVGSAFGVRLDHRCGAGVTRIPPATLTATARTLPLQRGPRPLPRLVGRQRSQGAIRSALEYGRDVEVVGSAGIGKTALIRTVCTGWLPATTPDGILVVPAGLGLFDTALWIYDACYDRPAGVVPDDTTLAEALGNLQLLLVVDDPLPDGAFLVQLRAWMPNSLLLCAGTHERLSSSTTVELDGLSDHHGLELIETAIGATFSVNEAHAARSASASVSGEPLSLVRLAALVRSAQHDRISIEAVIAEHDLDGPGANLLEAVLRLATPQERSVLETLAGFGPVGVSNALVAGVVKGSDPGAALHRLRWLGLAGGDEDTGWHAAADVGSTPDERRHAHRRLLRWTLSHRSEPAMIAASSATILTAAEAALADERPEDALQLTRSSETAMAAAGSWSAWRRCLTLGLQAARTEADADQVAYFEHELGVISLVAGDLAGAEKHLESALRARRYQDVEPGVATTTAVIDLLPPEQQSAIRAREPQARVDSSPAADSAGGSGTEAAVGAEDSRHPPDPLPDEQAVATAEDNGFVSSSADEPHDSHPGTAAAALADVHDEPPSAATASTGRAHAVPDVAPPDLSEPAPVNNRVILAIAGGALVLFLLVVAVMAVSGDDDPAGLPEADTQAEGSTARVAADGVSGEAGAAMTSGRVVLQPAEPALQTGETGTIPVWVWNEGDARADASLRVFQEGVAATVTNESCTATGGSQTCALSNLAPTSGAPAATINLEVEPEDTGNLRIAVALESAEDTIAEDAFTYTVSGT